MQTWLHFIGRQYYSISKFIRETERYGVSQRVSLRTLRRMNFGDRILLAQWDGKKAVAFGVFYIEGIGGVNAEVTARVVARYGGQKAEAGGTVVKRGCGSYVRGATYTVTASISQICDVIEEVVDKNDVQMPLLVKGRICPLATVGIPYSRVYLLSVPHTHGFRLFDWERFVEAVHAWVPGRDGRYKFPAVKGQFYASPGTGEIPEDTGGIESETWLREVKDYRKEGAAC